MTTSSGAARPSRTGGRIAVSRSSGGNGRRGRPDGGFSRPGGPGSRGAGAFSRAGGWFSRAGGRGLRAPSRSAALRMSLADRLWRPSLFTGRTRRLARRSSATCLRWPRRTQHI
ncbi:hypothetical protein FR943_04080 [Mycobacterium sp. TNTM28]|uniref:Uncharacterized protein n=1 Tax=[Mycobacterium] fortunisiensis TaxID=2600579 RepID=A0ABS6KHN8_9MYCO|nr:hypothetical protein [[Mycobacterium] fortunisiensis]